ncbi:class II histone deacetylase [Variovorax sp.]|jgi:acetoin utilization deacetylase AcuC-like enzyme|uniref:class II histone deacetylase n=1 Tax=Variovorax sp. TaxID=1871043 RepID=UPI0037DA2564
MKRTAFFHDERTLWHIAGAPHALMLPVGRWVQPMAGVGIAEAPDTKRRLKSLMDVSGLSDRLEVRSAPPASQDELLRVHTRDYLARFKAGSDAAGGDMGDLAPYGPGSYEIAALSAGLAIAAMDGVVAGRHPNAYAFCRPPGHHASADRGMGFCILNNIAIAIEAVKACHGIERIAVIDWDVHCGNGTQQLFYGRSDVLTISLHQEHCFPPGYSGAHDRGEGAGLGFNINIPLQPGGGHDAYMQAFERIVIPAVDRFAPQLVVVASGLDASGVDPLARMLLHPESFRLMTRHAMALAERHAGGRLVMVHEGGYSEVAVPFCGLAILEELSGHRTEVEDPLTPFFGLMQPSERFDAFQLGLIEELAALHGLQR